LSGARILVLGAAFKKDIDDARNSPAVRVMEILRSEGAELAYHDPFVPEVRLATGLFGSNGHSSSLRSTPLDPAAIAQADCVAILVAHSAVDYAGIVANSRLVFDAVNATRGQESRATVERL
jgi:UDP-N-acetyl-D-glucosamine dehydrogenase